MKRLLACASLILGNIVWFYAMKNYTDMRQVRIVSATLPSVMEVSGVGPIIERKPYVKFKGVKVVEVGYHYKKVGFGRNMTGTGVFIRNDGLILTAAHVVHNTRLAQISLNGFEAAPTLIRGFKPKPLFAAVIGVDEEHDIALLRVIYPGQYFRAVKLRKDVERGLPVFTVGFPGEFEKHVTSGIISSFSDGFTMTDVVIAHGSSGGGLFDEDGQLVGLCSFARYMEATEVFQGVSGFTDLTAMHDLIHKYKDF